MTKIRQSRSILLTQHGTEQLRYIIRSPLDWKACRPSVVGSAYSSIYIVFPTAAGRLFQPLKWTISLTNCYKMSHDPVCPSWLDL